MKTLKALITCFFFLLIVTSNAQNMTVGFDYLETGKYKKAEVFFETILINYPNNKTARLCYGRSIGLNGNPKKAKRLFAQLLEDYPNDFEIKLNYGESLLWNSNFELAKTYYLNLISETPNNFPALLGYANTLSNLKKHEDALSYVNKALEVSPKNPNALISKKHIYLGYAYQKQQEQLYYEAELLLIKGLSLFDNDKDILLNIANLYIITDRLENAEDAYNILAKQTENHILALNGLALISHLKHKEKKALDLSTQAFKRLTDNTDNIILQQTTERYIQALIWNKKYKKAKTLIDKIFSKQSNENWVLSLRATLNIYKSNFKKSLRDYDKILKNDSTSFDGNLGKANVLKALGYYDKAYLWAKNTLKIYNNQKDAINFINQLNTHFAPSIESKVSRSFDNGNNKAFSFVNNVAFPLSTKLSLLGNYNFRTTNNTVTDNSASSSNLSLGLSYQIVPNVSFKGTVGFIQAKAETRNYTQLLTDVSLIIKSIKLQTFDIGYKRDVQSFNAYLLDREIVQNHYYVNYNVSTNFNLGWFTQYYYTSQNDNNTRNLLFTSLYYNILGKPSLKVGLNYQYITFKDQVPNIYFSPSTFNAGEIFVNLIKEEVITNPKAFFYNVTAAFGHQFIEDNTKQSTYRLQGAFGYKFSQRSLLNLYGSHSNIASATAAGFTFTEIGLRFKWQFLE